VEARAQDIDDDASTGGRRRRERRRPAVASMGDRPAASAGGWPVQAGAEPGFIQSGGEALAEQNILVYYSVIGVCFPLR
jgi:hypothetical protein